MLRRNWVYILMCLALTFPAVVSSTISCEHKGSTPYLLDRVITWADGTTEHVQIYQDGFFTLDGTKRKLVGFVFGSANCESLWNTTEPWAQSKHWWWTAENLAFLDGILDYLQGRGVRLLRVGFPYTYRTSTADEAAAYRALLDLLKQHKMFIVGSVTPKYMMGFNCVPPTSAWLIPANADWGLPGMPGDTLGAWLKRLAPIIAEYPNVVSVCCDNELDMYSNFSRTTTSDGNPGGTTLVCSNLYDRDKCAIGWTVTITSGACNGQSRIIQSIVGSTITVASAFSSQIRNGVTFTVTQNYSVSDAVAHFRYLKRIFNTYAPNVIITHNFCSQYAPGEPFTDALLPLVDFPSCNLAHPTAAKITTALESFKSTFGLTNFWVNEIAKTSGGNPDNANFTSDFITSAFANGTGMALMFCASSYEAPAVAFFDANGNPKPQMVKVAQQIDRLQAPISQPTPTPIE